MSNPEEIVRMFEEMGLGSEKERSRFTEMVEAGLGAISEVDPGEEESLVYLATNTTMKEPDHAELA